MKGSIAKAARVFDALRIKMEAGAPAPVAEAVTEAPAVEKVEEVVAQEAAPEVVAEAAPAAESTEN
jgi:large subunit ribosomal protein L10